MRGPVPMMGSAGITYPRKFRTLGGEKGVKTDLGDDPSQYISHWIQQRREPFDVWNRPVYWNRLTDAGGNTRKKSASC